MDVTRRGKKGEGIVKDVSERCEENDELEKEECDEHEGEESNKEEEKNRNIPRKEKVYINI